MDTRENMTVKELTAEEHDELKERTAQEWFYNNMIDDLDDVTDEMIDKEFSGITFVPDDFFCNECEE